MTARTCVAIGCTSPVLARRLCLTHHRQLVSTGQACSVPGCDHPRRTGGMCTAHYQRSQKGAPLDKPLRVIHSRQTVIEDVEWIIGTDSPESIAVRLGYRRLDTLQTSLRKWGRADLADRLSPNGVRTAA